MRMTSSDFSFRLCAFSVLRARIWNATFASGDENRGDRPRLQLLEAVRRW